MTTRSSPQLTGYAAAWCIVFVWSFWLIVSRVAGRSGLTIYDLTAMRYGLAALVALPLSLYYKPWRGMRLGQIALISFILGPVYILCVFSGFLLCPGGPWRHLHERGALPPISILFGLILFRTLPGVRQLLGAALIPISTRSSWPGSGTATSAPQRLDRRSALRAGRGVLHLLRHPVRNAGGSPRCRSCSAARWSMRRSTCRSGRSGCPRAWPRRGGAAAAAGDLSGFVPNLVGPIFTPMPRAASAMPTPRRSSPWCPASAGSLGALILGETLSPPGMAAIALPGPWERIVIRFLAAMFPGQFTP
ncbi:MAG: EamA/RhaT family transporter [Paracoccaceae bacterium]